MPAGGTHGAADDDLPEICRVEGVIAPTVGFLVRMPTRNWNGKFMMGGCGGHCGNYLEDRIDPTLVRNYAVVNTDMGHKGSGWLFGYNNLQGQVDFAYRATHVTAVVAKEIIKAFHGNAASRNYFNCWSTGGRQAMISAQRFPDDFEGIIAGAPVYDEVGDSPYFLEWNLRVNTAADGSTILTADKLDVVHDAVLRKCDALGWLADGLLMNPARCEFEAATQEFFRLFLPPAVNHCRGGDGGGEANWTTALENWVEHGIAPDRVVAYWPVKPYVTAARALEDYGSTYSKLGRWAHDRAHAAMRGRHELDAPAATPASCITMRRPPPHSRRLTRRDLLLGAIALPALGSEAMPASGTAPAPLRAGGGNMSLALIGQCLIRHDLRQHPWPGQAELTRQLRAHDACFSDLEVALIGPRRGAPTRAADTLHTADPVVLDCLRDFGINLLATSNNHAFDIGTGGILDTMAALRARGIAFAGTGETLAAASAPTFLDTRGGRIALVAAAAGMIREGGAATDARAGVHELRRGAAGGLDAGDVERMLASLRAAAPRADVVIAYLHNHLWEADVARTADWQRELARRCVDAGASVFAAHGPPLLHGLETYRGAPLFHGLGSFIFQTRKGDDRYDDPNWESLVVECRFEGGRFRGARLTPVALARTGVSGPEDYGTRGRPSPAPREAGRATLGRLAVLSNRLGHRLEVDGATAMLAPG